MSTRSSDEALERLILQKFDELLELVKGLDDEQANATLTGSGNSVIQIVVHCGGMMRRWSSSVNLGVPIARDRAAEFQAHMTVDEATAMAAEAREGFVLDLRDTEHHGAPVVVPPGRDHYWTTIRHGVLLHVLEELSQHLGQAEITRDVTLAH